MPAHLLWSLGRCPASRCLASRSRGLLTLRFLPPPAVASSARQLSQQSHRQLPNDEAQQAAATSKRRRALGLLSAALTASVFATFYLWKEARLRSLESQAMTGRVGPEASVGSSAGASGQQQNQSLSVGGDFRLLDHTGRYVSRQDLGSSGSGWLLMYFGFCHCPDICPEQMEKMVEVTERLQLAKQPRPVTPVFVSIDPERDTPALVQEYIADFSKQFVGLTGSKAEVEAVAKKYRVYYSKGPVDQDGDYIVDHAIIMYLVSPDGRVVDYYGQTKTAKEIAGCIYKVIGGYQPAA